jgi:hypothetical protein
MSKLNAAPAPNWLETVRLAPISWARSREIDSPKPSLLARRSVDVLGLGRLHQHRTRQSQVQRQVFALVEMAVVRPLKAD